MTHPATTNSMPTSNSLSCRDTAVGRELSARPCVIWPCQVEAPSLFLDYGHIHPFTRVIHFQLAHVCIDLNQSDAARGRIICRLTSIDSTPKRKPNRSREYLTDADMARLTEAAKANRWRHRDTTMILVA